MRIRKRKVPLPISSLSPVPIWSSGPNLPLVVQLQVDQNPPRNLSLVADAASSFDPQPPDHPSQPSGAGVEPVKVLPEEDGKKRGSEVGGEMMIMMTTRSNDSSREGVDQLGAEIKCTVIKQPGHSSRDKAGGRCFEGEKSFPLKKWRGSIERRSSSDCEEAVDDKKMEIKVNNKCEVRNGLGGQGGEEEEEVKGLAMDIGASSTGGGARKKGRGGAILQGSRCSRVNGRGWRCCQQTLVGYSLCEHHLGKGRLRSVSNVSSNNRSKAGNSTIGALNKPNLQPFSSSRSSLLVSLVEDQGTKANEVQGRGRVDGGAGDDEAAAPVEDKKKPAIIVRRKTAKIGLVKARSLSSLLGLANEAISMAENEI